jgi:hypothetical protein
VNTSKPRNAYTVGVFLGAVSLSVIDLPQCEIQTIDTNATMRTVLELWQMAHNVYARARASDDPTMKIKLIHEADEYLKQANEIRLGQMTKAEWPRLDRTAS